MDHEKWLEQHDRMLADHDREMAEIRKDLGRAVKLSVLNSRNERKRRTELDQKFAQLAITLESFLKRGGNGKNREPSA